MTRWPTTLDRNVCHTLVALEKTAIAIIPSTVSVRTVPSCLKIPVSSAVTSRNGLSMLTPTETMIIASTTTSRAR